MRECVSDCIVSLPEQLEQDRIQANLMKHEEMEREREREREEEREMLERRLIDSVFVKVHILQ